MKRISSLLVAILLLMQAALVFADTTDYPYDTVGYFVEKAEFVGDDQIEATITYTSHYGSTANFHTISYLAVYNNETSKLLEVASQNVDLIKPFQYAGRVTLTQRINISKTVANVFSIKAIMIESLPSLRPNCPVPYMANEIIITPNNSRIPLITVDAFIDELDLDNTEQYINIQYSALDDVAIADGWYFGEQRFASQTKYLSSQILKGNIELRDYIGYLCVAKIDITDKTAPKLYSITKKAGKNTELVVDDSLFVDVENGYLTYYKTFEDIKTTRVQVENTLSVYDNFVRMGQTNNLQDTIGNVSYKFVDTDINGKYDKAFITNECSFVIGSVNIATNKIFRDTTNPNSMFTLNAPSSIQLDPLDDTLSWSIKDATGNNLILADLKAGQVANVRISDQGNYSFYEIIITEEKIEGIVTEVYTEDKKAGNGTNTFYKIGGNSYKTVNLAPLNPGDNISATLNKQGEIITFSTANTMKYGVVTGLDVVYSFGTTAQVQLMKQTSEITTFNLAKNVTVNGIYKTVSSAYPNIIALQTDMDKGDILIFETNSANEIKTIYTTSSGIQQKDTSMKFVDFSYNNPAVYNSVSGKLGSNYVLDSSVIYAVKTDMLTDKQDLILADKEILTDECMYSGTAIVKDGEIQAVVLFNTNYSVKPDSYPLIVSDVAPTIVDGDTRTKLKGLVNGIEKEYVGELDLNLNDVQVNDVIFLALNKKSEIAGYKKLADYSSSAFTVLDNGNFGGRAYDDNKDMMPSKNISLNLAVPTGTSTIAPNAVYTIGSDNGYLEGFSVAGRAYDINGNTLRLINNTYDNVCSTDGTKDYNSAVFEGDISDYSINPSSVAYVYNGITKKITATTISALETDKITGDYATKGRENDDLVYVYNYDGSTYMILIVDTVGDSDMSLVTPTYLEDGNYTFAVGTVDTASNKLYRNLESQYAQTTLTNTMVYLKPSITTIKNDVGTNITISDIKPLDIINLSVTTVSGNKKYDVVVNKKVVSGLVTEKIGNAYVINGVQYTLLNDTASLQLGVEYTLYLDKNSKIVNFAPVLAVNNYGVVTGVDISENFVTTAIAQIMNEKGEIVILDFAKNVNINGVNILSSMLNCDGISLMIGNTPVLGMGSLFIYELNSAGEIKTIYTTTQAIQTKDYSMRFVDLAPLTYNATSGKLGSNYISDSSIVYAVKTDFLGDKDDLALASKSILYDEEMYKSMAIVKEGVIQAVVLFSVSNSVRADSYPLVVTGKSTVYVDGNLRTKLKGLVNGTTVEYFGELDNFEVNDIQVNDVVQFALNSKNEICVINKLVDYDSYELTVNDNGNLCGDTSDNTKEIRTGMAVALNLSPNLAYPSTAYSITGMPMPIKGFAATGKAYSLQGNALRLINDYPSTFTQYGDRQYGYNEELITDITIDPNLIAYKYNSITKKITATTILDLETDKSTNDAYSRYSRDNDDLVYVYNYDGDTYMMLIVDTMGDN